MIATKSGKKWHVLGEVKDKDIALVACKHYDKSKRVWVYELKPKSEVQ